MISQLEARGAEQANQLIRGGPIPPASELTGEGTCALAWALKDQCHSSWSSEPQRAVRAAGILSQLGDAARPGLPLAAALEVDALVRWTAGLSHAIQGDMSAAIAAFDAAASLFAKLGQPCHAAQTQVPKIMALAVLGQHDEAARCADSALQSLIDHGDLATASKVLLNLGNLNLHADRYGAAAHRFREAAKLLTQVGNIEHSVMADIGLADALTALGELDQAVRTYEAARVRAETHGFPVLLALVEESVALLDLVCGRYHPALAGLESARRRYEALEMPQHLATAEKQLADAYLELSLLPEALTGYEAALARFQALDMQVERAWALVQRGRAFALSGQADRANASLNEAAPLFAELNNPVGGACVAMAQAELALANAQTQRALNLAREAAQRFNDAGLKDHQLRAEAVQAQAHLKLGAVERARQLFEATLIEATGHQLLPVQLRCLAGRAMTARACGDIGAARVDLQAAVELFEDQRRALPGDEIRSAFQGDHLLPFQELLRLELESLEAGNGAATQVLAALDRFRARTLADRLGAADLGQAPRPSEEAGTQLLRAQLALLYRRLHRLNDAAAPSQATLAELRETERALLERTRRARLSTKTESPSSDFSDVDTNALQRQLRPEDALVEYGLVDDELFACVVRQDGVTVKRRMASWIQVLEVVRSVQFQVDALRHGSAPMQHLLPLLERRIHRLFGRLHELIWKPLEPVLAGRHRVLVVPHAQLGSVPFAALHDGEVSVAERVLIVLAPSARLALRALTREPLIAATVLALGESTRLPHAAREATEVSAMLSHGRAFVGPQATIENLLAHAHSADVIHLACHAQFRSDNPEFSALHLHDGALTAELICALRLPGANIVLSGCETALGDAAGGNEMFGLTRAFLVAGASRVLAALWPVDDATSAEMMTEFYAGLRQGQSPGAALRNAQLSIRRRRPHPFFWASFTLTGRW